MASLLPQPKQLFQDNAWNPLVDGQIFTYAAGTLTLKDTFQDAALSIANTNPIAINARGEVVMYGDGAYRVILKDSLGNTLYDRDNIESPSSLVAASAISLLSQLAALSGSSFIGYSATNTSTARTVQAKLRESRSITDFGAVGDGITDSRAAINAALTSGFKTIIVPDGNFKVSGRVTVPADVSMVGQGVSSIISPLSAIGTIIEIQGGNNSSIRDIQVTNSGFAGQVGIEIFSDFARVERCYFANVGRPILIQGGEAIRILNNTMIGSDFGIFSADDFRNSLIHANHIQGGTCIWIDKSTTQCEGLRITDNILLPSVTLDPNSGHGIAFVQSCLEMEIANNIVDNIDKFGLYIVATNAGGNYEHIKVTNNWFGCDAAVAGSRGVYMVGGARYVTLTGNTMLGANSWGMEIDILGGGPPNKFSIVDNHFTMNGTGDLRIKNLLFSNVNGNSFDSAVSTLEADNTSTCNFFRNFYTFVPSGRSTASTYQHNVGFVTESKGSGTVPTGATNSANILHGLSVTPRERDFVITPKGPLSTNDTGNWVVSAIDATKFNVFVRNNPGATPFSFDWSISYTNG